MTSPWPIPVTPLAPVACGTLLWRRGNTCGATLVVKATFGLANDDSARLIAPVEVVREDRYRGPGVGLEEASEIAPFLPGAGIILSAVAYAPRGRPVPAVSVRLGVHREGPVLDKVLHVLGDRSWESPGAPRPFDAMPIVWERAYGGPGVDDNPAGTGAVPGSALPNVLDPERPTRPAGFGPVARNFGLRRRLLGAVDPWALNALVPVGADETIPEIPPGLDAAWFHAAPADQRIASLQGDEWIVLDGLHASLPRIQTRLPSVRAHARWQLVGQAGPGPAHPLALSADTLVIKPDRGICSVLWRGHVIMRPDDLAHLVFLAGVETEGYPLAAPLVAAAAPGPAGYEPLTEADRAPTEKVRLPGAPTRKIRVETPASSFDPNGTTQRIVAGAAQRPALPFKKAEGPPAEPRPAASETAAGGAPLRSALPFAPAPRPDDDPSVTSAIDLRKVEGRAVAPFTLAEPGAKAATAASIPGAQWSAGAAPATALPFAVAPPPPPTAPPPPPSRPEAVPSGLPFIAPPAALPFVPSPPPEPAPPPIAPRPLFVLGMAELAPPAPPAPVAAAPAISPPDEPGEDDEPPTVPPPRPSAPASMPLAASAPAEAPPPAAPEPAAPPPAPAPTGVAAVVMARLAAREPVLDLDLGGADLSDLDLTGAVLSRVNLEGARLVRCKLGGARLAGARLAQADLTGADLSGADLAGAQLGRAVLDGASFEGARLEQADLGRASCHKTSFLGADLRGASLQRVTGDGADLAGAELGGADLRQSRLQNASFRRAVLRDVSAGRADLTGSRFDRADLQGATLRGAKLTGVSLAHAQLDGADLRDADLEGANVFGASRKTAKLGANPRGLVEVDPQEP